MKKNLFTLLLAVIVTSHAVAQQNSKPSGAFRAAVVKVDITPESPQWLRGYNPRQSTEVHDRIYHRIVALDDGKTQFYLISSEVVGIPVPEYERVADMLKKTLGIDPMNVWWTVTHTHSAPEIATHFKGVIFPSMARRAELAAQHEPDVQYTATFEQKLIDGIKEARSKLAPARFGAGWGFSQANINRRAIDVNGKASLGLNPDGEVDRRIGVIRIDKADGTPMAIIANYAMHGTVLSGESTVISGDAPGIVAEYVEEKTSAPMLYINGAAGNLAPIYSVYPTPGAGHLMEFRKLLGEKILEAHGRIVASDDKIKLVTGSTIIETPMRSDVEWASDIKKHMRTTNKGQQLVRLPIRFLKINSDISIWSAPVEMFCEISNDVRDLSPFPYTFFFGYANGSLGYLPDETAWQYGGYETGVSTFTPSAHKDVREGVVGYLKGELMGGER